MNHTSFRPANLAARAVNRAMGEIRRGVPVVIAAPGDTCLVALPAETATDATLQEFLAAADAGAQIHLVLSRAADLQPGSARPSPATSAAPGIVAIPIGQEQLTAQTLRALADPTRGDALPDHRHTAQAAGNLQQAAIELAKLARLLPAMLVAHAAQAAAANFGLLEVSADDLLAYPSDAAESLLPAAAARVPLDEAEDVRIVAFRPPDGGIEHLAILIGDPAAADAPLARIHSECFTGDLLGSRRCDCGPQLHQAIRRMAAEGAGVILYMAQEGRGIGLVNKLRAYTLQDGTPGHPGLDTLDANRALGYGADERSFAAAAAMLRQLNIRRVRLLTNNPAKIAGLATHGIEVASRVSAAIAANGENDSYLETKARRFGHLLG